MSDEGTAPRGFDLCVNVLSTDFDITKLFPALKTDEEWKGVQEVISKLPGPVKDMLNGKLPPLIVLYAQWCPVGDQQKYNASVDAWFQQFRGLKYFRIQFDEISADMSVMVGHWLFPKRREFPRPYVKRTYATNSKTLGKDLWVDTLVERLSKVCSPYEKLDDANHRRWIIHCTIIVRSQPRSSASAETIQCSTTTATTEPPIVGKILLSSRLWTVGI